MKCDVFDLNSKLMPISHCSFSILVNKNEKCLSSQHSLYSLHRCLNMLTSLFTMASSRPKHSTPGSPGSYAESSFTFSRSAEVFQNEPFLPRKVSFLKESSKASAFELLLIRYSN